MHEVVNTCYNTCYEVLQCHFWDGGWSQLRMSSKYSLMAWTGPRPPVQKPLGPLCSAAPRVGLDKLQSLTAPRIWFAWLALSVPHGRTTKPQL